MDVLDELRKVLKKHGYEHDESEGEGGIVAEALDIPPREVWINAKKRDSIVLTELHPDELDDILPLPYEDEDED